jgi:TPR repeat protein
MKKNLNFVTFSSFVVTIFFTLQVIYGMEHEQKDPPGMHWQYQGIALPPLPPYHYHPNSLHLASVFILTTALIQDTQASLHAGNALMQRRDERMQKLVREAAAEIEKTKRMIEHLEKRLAGKKREDDVRQKFGQEAAGVHELEEVEQYCLPALECGYGQEVHQAYAQPREWFEKATAQGDAFVQDNFDSLCHSDQGVSQGNAQAQEWFEKAAVQGDAGAQNNLGCLDYNGLAVQPVQQDCSQAREWFEKAAAQGDAGAQNNLGCLDHNGLAVRQDCGQAREWFEKAAAQGHLEAQNSIKELQQTEKKRRVKRKSNQQEAVEAQKAGEPEKQRDKASQKAKKRSRASTKRKALEGLTDLALKQEKTAVVKQRTTL